jgi:hypothetical protein
MRDTLLDVVLQATPDPDKYADAWGDGSWFEALVEPFMDLLGPVFPLVVGLAIAGIMYVYSGGMALPVAVLILIGGMLMPFLPPAAQNAALLLIVGGIGLALFRAWMNSGGRL